MRNISASSGRCPRCGTASVTASLVDGDFTLSGRDELSEFLAAIGKLVGEDALGQFRTLEGVP